MMTDGPKVALALGGGGARAAYQAGVLRALVREVPELRFAICPGVSAGAINTAFLSNYPGPLPAACEAMATMWGTLRLSNVFRTSPISLGSRMLRTMVQITSGIPPGVPPVQGMVD